MVSRTKPLADSPTAEPGSGTSARLDDPTASAPRWAFGLALGFVLTHALLGWLFRLPAVTIRNDDGLYILLSHSIRALQYRDTHLIGAPWHAQYPPGYPVLLGGFAGIFGDHVDVYILPGLLLSTLGIALLFDLIRRVWSWPMALAVGGLAALQPDLIRYAGAIVSESSYFGLVMVALWIVTTRPPTRGWLIAAGGVTIASALVRSNGVALVAALGLVWMLERRWRAVLVYGAASALTVGVWFLWTAVAPTKIAGRSYVADAMLATAAETDTLNRFERLVANTLRYVQVDFGNALPLPVIPGTPLDNAFTAAMFGLALPLGLWLAWRRWRIGALYFALYIGVLLIWPWRKVRFVTPVEPILLLLVVAALVYVAQRWSRVVGFGMLGVLLAGNLYQTARDLEDIAGQVAPCRTAEARARLACFNERQRGYVQAARFAGEHTPPDARFIVGKEATFGYYSGRQAQYSVVAREDTAGYLSHMARLGIDYAVLGHTSNSDARELGADLAGICSELMLVQGFEGSSYLFRRRGPGDDPADRAACGAVAAFLADTLPPSQPPFHLERGGQ